MEENSSDEGKWVVHWKVDREEFKIIIKFRKEDEQVVLNSIAVSRELEKKIRHVEKFFRMEFC